MNFEGDAFISYAHLDDIELIEGRKGWVATLHRALAVRVGQLLGEVPRIWRDPKLQGNDLFDETLIERLHRVAVLISVVSPRYVRSEWTQKELTEFWNAAEQQGGIRFHEKARIFKVLKTPVPLEMHPPKLRSLLGYEFFKIDPDTGRPRELDEAFGPDAQRDFWFKLDDLAQDICRLLEGMRADSGPLDPAETELQGECVFLAETTSDLREQRDSIRRDLQQHGCTVLPSQVLPHVASELKTAVRADLARCRMSIHVVGKNYSLVPRGTRNPWSKSSISLRPREPEKTIIAAWYGFRPVCKWRSKSSAPSSISFGWIPQPGMARTCLKLLSKTSRRSTTTD